MFPCVPGNKVSLDGGSKAPAPQKIDLEDPSGPKISLDGSLGIHLPWISHLSLRQIIASKEILRAVRKKKNFTLVIGEYLVVSKHAMAEMIGKDVGL